MIVSFSLLVWPYFITYILYRNKVTLVTDREKYFGGSLRVLLPDIGYEFDEECDGCKNLASFNLGTTKAYTMWNHHE